MANQSVIGIDAFKHLPCHSSSDSERIGYETERMVAAAKEQYDVIHGYADLQMPISASAVDKCWDSLAVIKQLAAALSEISEHFAATHMHDSLQATHARVKESLRKAERELKCLAALVER